MVYGESRQRKLVKGARLITADFYNKVVNCGILSAFFFARGGKPQTIGFSISFEHADVVHAGY